MIKRLASLIFPRLLGSVPKNVKLLYPFYLAGRLNTVRTAHQSPSVPPAFDGFRIAYASDIHFGPLFHEHEALALAERLRELDADLTILGGDFGNEPDNALKFIQLLPPFPEGRLAVAVLGNHDYGPKWPGMEKRLEEEMRRKNIRLLFNQALPVTRDGGVMAVCGPEDFRVGKPDLKAMMKGAEGADYVLFIPHNPDLIPEAHQAGFRFHLAICGHTHGGQIVFFGRSLHSSSEYGDRYRSGWYREQGADILVSEGVGTSILPMRIGTRSMVHEVTLIHKAQ